jgi:beta-lactamase superfamily II metal-dependent hydrolase
LSGDEYGTPPRPSELEIALIGPGFGECVLAHLGGGAWVIVDSCRDNRTGKPAPLQYLRDLGVDPGNAVRAIVLTHYHDDHIAGAAETLDACQNAVLCCPAGMDSREFRVRVGAFSRESLGLSAVTQEIWSVFEVIKKRKQERGAYPVVRAIANTTLVTVPSAESGHGLPVTLHALSPSARDHDLSIDWLAKSYAERLAAKTRPTAFSPNSLSVAMLLVIGDGAVLLGSDLETHGEMDRGWGAVVQNPNRPGIKAAVLKIPHHGGESAHLHEMWTSMLHASPWSVLTPWQLGGNLLPTDTDIHRIGEYTQRGFSTARRRRGASKIRRDRAVEKTVAELGTALIAAEPATGIVRLRCSTPDNLNAAAWSIAMFGGACQLAAA